MSEIEPDLRELESHLKQLPLGRAPNRDRLMYEAGRASVRGSWLWPMLAVTFAFVCVWQASQPEARVTVVQFVPVDVTSTVGPVSEPSTASPAESIPLPPMNLAGWQLRQTVLLLGVDALPPPAEPMPIDTSRDTEFSQYLPSLRLP